MAAVKIKKNGNNTKFKVRTSSYLYTLVVADKAKAEKLVASFPPGLDCLVRRCIVGLKKIEIK